MKPEPDTVPPRTVRQCGGTTQKGARCGRTKMASSKDAQRDWSCWQHAPAQPDAKLHMRCNGIAASTKSRCKISKRTTSEHDAVRGYYCHHHTNQASREKSVPDSAAASEMRCNGIPAQAKLRCMDSKGTPSQRVRESGIPALHISVRLVNSKTEEDAPNTAGTLDTYYSMEDNSIQEQPSSAPSSSQRPKAEPQDIKIECPDAVYFLEIEIAISAPSLIQC
ncbi:hypothetical protein FIBSPDRAFT_1045386 [Athelia psychrophila]|uniref:Uncharacterized protein n=1 Tax=Athelia psychrophila TaxID=1759441 RepID=A0A166I9W2_9AGAM|nr:hypothetical protein FIBSPDRAFT_1045386 [Fibularhizoctonia sp. CBS 109695]